MNFEEQNEPASPERIEAFEKTRGVRLPEDYKAFLLETNGGKPAAENSYAKVAGWNWLVMEILYGLTDRPSDSIDAERFNNFSDFIHARMLPFGYASACSLYMDLRDGAAHGKIYVMSRPPNATLLVDDTGFQDEDDYEDGLLLHPVANTFSEFLAMLGPDPNEA